MILIVLDSKSGEIARYETIEPRKVKRTYRGSIDAEATFTQAVVDQMRYDPPVRLKEK